MITDQSIMLNIDNVHYTEKPSNKEAAKIVIRLKNRNAVASMTIAEFAEAIQSGQTYTCGVLHGTTNRDWQQQQIFAVDIDNKDMLITPKEAGKKFRDIGLDIALFYHSFSSTREIPKYRFIFICNEVISDADECTKMNLALVNVFEGIDLKTANLNHMMYSTNKKVHLNESARLFDKQILLDIYGKQCKTNNTSLIYEPPPPKPPRQVTNSVMLGNGRYIDWGSCMENARINVRLMTAYFDLYRYIQDFKSYKKIHKKGTAICFDGCPLCGHNDCFMYLAKSNTYYCHSCGSTGNIINFVQATQGFSDKKTAIDYIKYNVCEIDRKAETKLYNKVQSEKRKAQHENK